MSWNPSHWWHSFQLCNTLHLFDGSCRQVGIYEWQKGRDREQAEKTLLERQLIATSTLNFDILSRSCPTHRGKTPLVVVSHATKVKVTNHFPLFSPLFFLTGAETGSKIWVHNGLKQDPANSVSWTRKTQKHCLVFQWPPFLLIKISRCLREKVD